MECRDECANLFKHCDFRNGCNEEKLCDVKYFVPLNGCVLEYNTKGEILSRTNYPFMSIFKCSFNKCPNGYFLCSFYKFCLSIDLVCDGINHCLRNEDETNCGRIIQQKYYFLFKEKNKNNFFFYFRKFF